ncbi:MAG: hypothetical protein JWM56_1407 [Candidatus Peribacteria bacterium]|nr:hypothetical protein [Candidatus Peribacteria bacterium]
MNALTSFLQSFASSAPHINTMSTALLGAGILAVFLIFFTTRDILLRTQSFVYQFICILLVAIVPGIGFLLYLLIRPSRTVKQKELESLVLNIHDRTRRLEEHLMPQTQYVPEKKSPKEKKRQLIAQMEAETGNDAKAVEDSV